MLRERRIPKTAYPSASTSATTPSETSSASPTSPASTRSSRTKPSTTMLRTQAVPPDLLLERHGAGVSETCGTAVSPPAEKNSFAPNPSGLATSTHGMLWIAVLKCITVEL